MICARGPETRCPAHPRQDDRLCRDRFPTWVWLLGLASQGHTEIWGVWGTVCGPPAIPRVQTHRGRPRRGGAEREPAPHSSCIGGSCPAGLGLAPLSEHWDQAHRVTAPRRFGPEDPQSQLSHTRVALQPHEPGRSSSRGEPAPDPQHKSSYCTVSMRHTYSPALLHPLHPRPPLYPGIKVAVLVEAPLGV